MTTSWWEIKVLCVPELEELVFWRLQKHGFSGTVTETKGEFLLVRAYLPETSLEPLDLAAIAKWLQEDGIRQKLTPPITAWEIMPNQDWQDAWKQHWQPQPIGDRFLVYPAWLEPPVEQTRKILRLDPGVAFGTGEHPTTQLCLESLEMHFFKPPQEEITVADIGCGSGILSIGAVLLGAKHLYAVDTDPLAVQSAMENRDLNGISSTQMRVSQGSAATLLQKGLKADGIVCNILAEVIIELMPQITLLAKPNSWAVLSGIILDQVHPVVDCIETHHWTLATIWKRENWCCLNLRRP